MNLARSCVTTNMRQVTVHRRRALDSISILAAAVDSRLRLHSLSAPRLTRSEIFCSPRGVETFQILFAGVACAAYPRNDATHIGKPLSKFSISSHTQTRCRRCMR